jgi:hypothetical protein
VHPATKTERVLSRDELQEFSRELSLLSPHTVQDLYTKAHQACCLASGLPSPAQIQKARCDLEASAEVTATLSSFHVCASLPSLPVLPREGTDYVKPLSILSNPELMPVFENSTSLDSQRHGTYSPCGKGSIQRTRSEMFRSRPAICLRNFIGRVFFPLPLFR